jgi:peptide chain release factor 2
MIETEQIKYELPQARENLKEIGEALRLDDLTQRIAGITEETEREGFWDDHLAAGKLLKEKKALETRVSGYEKLAGGLEEIEVMIDLADEEDDTSLAAEAKAAYTQWKGALEAVRLETLLDGEYDASGAIVSIHAGSGGTDAQDWAEMLLRMYLRWAEKRGYKTQMYDRQDADEGGIKSAMFSVEGPYAYGYLKNEKGVHRIVRISPYDSSARRHTSFSSVDVMPEIDDEIEVEISPDDIRVDTFRASGAGGQHVNKTDSAIRITHLPTNIVVTCQNERSQHQNKEVAMRILKSKLVELAEQEHKEKIDELAGDYSQITWGSQIRSYVFHPYSLVKDHRTEAENGNVQAVMDGDLDLFINEKLKQEKENS